MSSIVLSADRLVYRNPPDRDDRDSNMYSSILSLITCKICSGVLNDPYDCLCCNNTFCLACINQQNNCPFQSNGLETTPQLKLSSTNISNFLANLKFKCIFSSKGCSEEISYNKIASHEATCLFGKKSDSRNSNSLNIITSGTYNSNDSFNKQPSIMSFNNKNVCSEAGSNSNDNPNTGNDKIDKIYETLLNIQFLMTNKSFVTPTKEIYANETPKFSVSNIKHDNNANPFNTTDSHSYHSGYNLTVNLQQEKIISEIEFIQEKISSIETQLEHSAAQNEVLFKKVMEEQLTSFFEKFTNFPSTHYSTTSTTNSIKSLNTNNLSKCKSSSKFELESNSLLKKINEKSKLKEKEQSAYATPVKTHNKIVSPRFIPNKQFLKESKVKPDPAKIKINESNLSSYNSKEGVELFSSFANKLESIEKQLTVKLIPNAHFTPNVNIIEEIKTFFLEVTLDSTNLFVQKFDELISQFKSFSPLNCNEKNVINI